MTYDTAELKRLPSEVEENVAFLAATATNISMKDWDKISNNILATARALSDLMARVEEMEAALKELVRIDDGQRKSTVPIYAPGSKMDQAYAAARAALKGGA